MPDDNPETIERVISYLYLQDYEEDGHTVQLDSITELGQLKTEPHQIAISDLNSKRTEDRSEDSERTRTIAYNDI